MKAGLAIMVALAEWASSTALDGSLVLQFAVGEETAEPGTSSLLAAGFGGDVGVTLEPTSLDVGIATRGLAHIEVTLHGRSGHAGRIDFDGNPLSTGFLTSLPLSASTPRTLGWSSIPSWALAPRR